MSLVPKRLKQAVALSFILIVSATSGSGQSPPQKTYVCQTIAFWCAFQFVPGVPDGASCYCGTVFGPIYGISIDPTPMANTPILPKPQPRIEETPTRTVPRKEVEVAADDCYKGLGNCQGSFVRSGQVNSNTANGVRAGSRGPRRYEGTLAEGASRRITLSLDSGVFYTITGGCDIDCDDLDLTLRLGTTIVDDDTQPDDAPAVVVLPKSAGTYSLEVLMASCSELLCSYTIQIEER